MKGSGIGGGRIGAGELRYGGRSGGGEMGLLRGRVEESREKALVPEASDGLALL